MANICPTWTAVMEVIITALEDQNATDYRKEAARKELRRIAIALDEDVAKNASAKTDA